MVDDKYIPGIRGLWQAGQEIDRVFLCDKYMWITNVKGARGRARGQEGRVSGARSYYLTAEDIVLCMDA